MIDLRNTRHARRITKYAEWASCAFLFAGVWLVNNRDPRAFVFWILGNGLSVWPHIEKRMWGMVIRDIGFLAMAVWGLVKWNV